MAKQPRRPAPADTLRERPTRARGNIDYGDIDATTAEGRRAAAGLLRLKTAIERHVPPKLVDGNFLLATWNIRELGGTKHGGRTNEALHYIAEIVSAFDAVAIQEVRSDVTAFRRVQALLGPWWKYLVTDVTVGTRGNHERLAFLYDSRKVQFAGVASQVVLPPKVDRKARTRSHPAQLARTPFMVGLQSGWFRFVLCAAHILYGTARPDDPERIAEIRGLARHLVDRAEDPYAFSENVVVLGDFNIFDPGDPTMAELTAAGFVVPPEILRIPRRRHYDQIAFRAPYLQARPPARNAASKAARRSRLDRSRAGVFPMYDYVFREAAATGEGDPRGDRRADSVEQELRAYAAAMKLELPPASQRERRRRFLTRFRDWRSYQLSDHAPLWIELDTDWSRGLLARRMRGQVGTARRQAAPAPLPWRKT